MRCELIAVGTELLTGDVVNTNTAYIAKMCQKIGIEVTGHRVVGDSVKALSLAFLEAFERVDLIILSGGLGPTYDDMTKETVASLLKVDLVIDRKAKAQIDAFFSSHGFKQTENNVRQAYILKGSEPLYNEVGLAVGSYFTINEKIVILLPGPPYEMKAMFDNEVMPRLMGQDEKIVEKYYHFFDIGEAELEDRLYDLMTSQDEVLIAPYAKPDMVTIKLTAKGDNLRLLDEKISHYETKLLRELDDLTYVCGSDEVSKWLLDFLIEEKKTLTVAESCTGGLLSSMITAQDGASSIYKGGVCAYTKEVKHQVIGVENETIATDGVYSEKTAYEMAKGTRLLFGADYAISTSGVAGDSDEGTPRGKVYYAFVSKNRKKTGYFQIRNPEHKDRVTIQEMMAKKILILFFKWLKEND